DGTNRNVAVTVTDNAGNTNTTADTTNATVDSVVPTVTDARISISGATGMGGTYKIGDTVTATWNNTAGGDNNTDTISAVTFDFSAFGGGSAVAATNSGGTWTATYTLVAGALNGATNRNVSATVTDNAGNTKTTADTTNATVDNQAPASTSVTVPADSTYGAGANWDFTVNFDQAITVTGSPQIDLTVGSTTRQAVYVSGSGTSALLFRYTTQTGDNDSDGIAIGGNIALAGGTLTDAAGNNATLTLNGVAATSGVRIATNFLPTLSSLGTLTGANEDTERAISLADLAAAGNEADTDGSVTAFVVKAVSSGSLRIGTDAASATAWNATTNAVIDATHQAYWTPAANANGNLNAFTVVARDNVGGDSLTPVQVVVNAAAINDAPTLAVNGGLTLNEGATATIGAGDLAAGDPDDSGTGLTYTVTAAPAHGQLELSGAPGIAISSFTQDDLDNNRLRYVHDGGESSSDGFTFTLADGGENGAAALSGQTFAITINPVNDAPAISQLGGDSQSYLMASGARLIDQGTLPGVTDGDSSNFDSGTLTVAITGNRVSAEDVLAIRHQGNGAGQIGVSGGNVSYGGVLIGTATGGTGTDDLVITFNANANATAVAALLANITYENVDTLACTASIRSISFTLTDGDGGTSAPQVATVDVSQNTPPTATDGSVTLNEDTSHVFSAAAFHFNDADGGDSLQSIRITRLPAAGGLTLAGSAVTLNQVISAADIAAGKLQFTPAADANGAAYAQFQFQVSDGKSYSVAHTLTLNVTAVDDAPTLATVPGTRYTDTTANDAFTAHSGTLSGQDKDGEALTYGIQGATPAGGTATLAGRYGTLSLNTATGAYTYTPNDSAINALSSAASDPFTFTVSDGHTLVSTTFTVDLVGTNDAPVLATPTPLHYTDTAATDTFAAQNGSLTATDKDGTATLTYGLAGATISGTTATLAGRYGTLTLDTRSGAYRYQPNPGAINALSGPAEETFTLSVSDGNASSDARLTVAIAGADDAPGGRVSIGGAPVAGGTLTVQQNLQDAEGMGAVSLQWQAGDGHGGWVDIAGATGSQLTVSADLAGKAIRALASYTDGAGNATVVASSATEAVSNVPPPPIPVTAPVMPTTPGAPAATAVEAPPPTSSLPPVVFLPPTSTNGLQHLTSAGDGPASLPIGEASSAATRETGLAQFSPTSLLTRPATPGGFQVVVVPQGRGQSDALLLSHPLNNVVLPAGSLEMVIPADTFAHTNPQATVHLQMLQADGRPLPPWASFDPRTGKIKLQPPPGTRGELTLRLVARDNLGHEAVTTFSIVIGRGEKQALETPAGRSGLNEQLQRASQRSGFPERLAAQAAAASIPVAPAQA
ncbi:cadherin-like domain-containing protein, partial [Azospira sp. I13]|uniref:cadherin-like domain-containing protein n=1 Tax=Azospira sp. I13 TaxID=1765050 RepID=UPI001F2BDBFF